MSTAATAAPSTAPRSGAAAASSVPIPRKLDELLALGPDTLRQLYEGASVPRLPDLTGDLRGRMLAWHGVRGAGALAIRALASRQRFPWRGKSFAHQDDARGGGINRV